MKILPATTPGEIAIAAAEAAQVLKNGGVILYPTDTVYGLGAAALSDAAVAAIYAIKGRAQNKPIHAIVESTTAAATLGEWNAAAEALGKAFLPGPLTLILKKHAFVTGGIAQDQETIGIRIPHHPFCTALAQTYGQPFTTTSANRSGQPTLPCPTAILTQLGAAAQYIDLVIDSGTLPPSSPSTVVDCTTTPVTVLRTGAIKDLAIASVHTQ